MWDRDPGAPPSGGLSEGREAEGLGPGMWRDGKYLVVRRGAVFPDVCIKSNLPAHGGRVVQVIEWHPRAWYAIRLLHPAADAAIWAFATRKATLEVGLSKAWLRKRLRGRVFGGTVIAGGFAAMVAALVWMTKAFEQGMLLFLVGMFVMFAGLVYAMSANVLVSARRMSQDYIWLRGIHRDFLACCPVWPGEDGLGRS